MSELIDYTIVCFNCKHKNNFKLKGEIIHLIGGGELPVIRESIGDRICEGCGRELHA